MKQSVRLLTLVALAGCTACAAFRQEKLTIRPVGEAVAARGSVTPPAIEAGDALMGRGEFALAVDVYRQAVYTDPSSARGYNGMAIAYASMGRYDLSGRFFELALSRAPGDAKIYRNLARSLDKQGRHEEAMAVQREMEDAIRLARATQEAEQIAAIAPERPSLAALAGKPVQAVTDKPVEGLHLERRSLGEVALVTAPAKPASVPPVPERTPPPKQSAAKTGLFDTLFSQLWTNWPAPRAKPGDRQSEAS